MEELYNLIKQKKSFFKESKEQSRQKIIVAIKRLSHPFTLLTFAYLFNLASNMLSRSTPISEMYA